MDLKLLGKRALVTGGSGGIGTSIARLLAAEGCAVLVHGRDAARTEEVVAALRGAGAQAEAVLGDLGDDESAAEVARRAADWGTDILVNNAGPFAEHDWDSATPEDWLTAMNGNLISAVRMVRVLVPGMRERGWGRVINVGSRAAVTALPNMVEYSAAKAAVLNATTSLARHLSGTGITANTVSPGVIVSPGLRRMFEERAAEEGWEGDWPAIEQRVTREYAPNPSGRLGTGEDIAAAVAYLASPLADYVNGTNLRVDGGITPVP
ncbi:SDR family NAD(P)-dependent oxidoreductase [Streptomyces cucumeris]|uniref:SDR family NAD(P)-dependent oxidoreductase n=1 Tax=Streptomyces cucumeris TaxID=2962890 RepID=UPI003D751C71